MAGSDDELVDSTSLLGDRSPRRRRSRRCSNNAVAVAAAVLLAAAALLAASSSGGRELIGRRRWTQVGEEDDEGMSVKSEVGVVAADDGRCSEIGAAELRSGGHAVDAAVATAACLGVVHAVSSGIGGGAFLLVRSAATAESLAFDARETAPSAANQNMYKNDPSSKERGALAMGVPGELAGMHAAWSRFGRLPWRSLFQPSIKLAREGFLVGTYLARAIRKDEAAIMADPGLRAVYAPAGKILVADDTCHNPKLADTLEAIADEGAEVFYGGSVGRSLVGDVGAAGGILTMEDLRGYEVKVSAPVSADVMGFTILGMPLPSSGTLGMAMVMNVLAGYGSRDELKGPLGLHRLIEALKHMFAIRTNLGDPGFVNVAKYQSDMLSPEFAATIRGKIFDNTTFDPDYYLNRWNQLRDHGTSHFSVVDSDRNAVAMTTSVNNAFGAKKLSPSTGVVLNNEMSDFSTPTEAAPGKLPPAPANFIEPNKRPLSSMTPIIILKDNQLAGVIGGAGGMHIIPAVIEVFLNHFVLGDDPLAAVRRPRVYHKVIPNVVEYENWTTAEGEHIELDERTRVFLEKRGHRLRGLTNGTVSVCQLVVHDLRGRRPPTEANDNKVFHGMLTAVSDPRKDDGRSAGL